MASTGVAKASRRPAPRRTWVAILAVVACVGQNSLSKMQKKHTVPAHGLAFVPPASEVHSPRIARSDKVIARAQAQPEREMTAEQAQSRTRQAKTTLKANAGTGMFQSTDMAYNPAWSKVEENEFANLGWMHDQTVWAGLATAIFSFDMIRILLLVPPTVVEVAAVGVIYFGLYASRHQEVPKLEPHYQVSFYASIGWTFYAWASLVHGMAYGPTPLLPVSLAEPLHSAACIVYLASCAYFYSYHWGRHIKHISEGRFRPWFAAGLASLTAVHSLTVGHILKVLDDPGWWGTVVKIYPGEWQWLADTRLLELYLTAAALFLVIMHLKGVLTGTKNAALVFMGTVILPTAALMLETFGIKACAWEHYFMVGPKYF